MNHIGDIGGYGMDLYNMDLKRYAGHISMNQKMFLYEFRKYNDNFGERQKNIRQTDDAAF